LSAYDHSEKGVNRTGSEQQLLCGLV